MIQAMQILQLSTLGLEDRIEQELVENPFLEVSEPEREEAPQEAQTATEGEAAGETDGLVNMLDELERYEHDYGDGGSRMPGSVDGDKKYEAMQNAPTLPETLADALLRQIALLALSEREREIIEYLIWSFDGRGYLTEALENISIRLTQDMKAPPVEEDEVENALVRLRQATHPAMGARDLRECLLLQIEARGIEAPLLHALIADHLQDLEANRMPRIAKATGRSIDDIKLALARMRELDPIPGSDFGEARATVITPDVVVEDLDGDYVIKLERERIPKLMLSPSYRRLLSESENGDGVREWVRKRVESARWFIDAVEQRQSTLRRISEAVFRHQRDFLERGVSGLRPLRMQEVADEIKVHISTVSRGVSGKYAQTPRGIFPLKYFFTGGTAKSTGEVASQVSIKELLRELVSQEDPKKPFSDDQLAAKLEERDGISIARRTVTKYRKALDIPSSSQRRSY